MTKELTEENYPRMNVPRMSSEGMTTDEIKRLVTLGQRFATVSDEHRLAIFEQIVSMRDEDGIMKEYMDRFEKMKIEDPESYAIFQSIAEDELSK
jgi:hypothetical protein